ncbi:DsrE family protein [Candidatus Woesearchaeota archaeon]|nr:DsrE family protein [Candidatus Woesearchaeota archaeon]
MQNQGQILACGTCLKSRHKGGSNVCPISTMQDLLKIVEESDKLLTFG